MTEMKFIPQIHDNAKMVIIIELYMNCDRETSGGVKPPSAADRASKRCDLESKRPGYAPEESPSTQFVCESTKRQE